ncbi:MAG: pilus assembly protein [Marinosulfonomonas sp.]|nr:pilus assembly protein [Marinosulfonomonas sp.]
MTSFNQIRRVLKRRARQESGTATIEFALLFPAFITLFLMVFETGLLLTRGVMLDRGVDISMRELRLGTLNPMTHTNLKSKICANSAIIPDCMESVTVELLPVDSTWMPLATGPTCVDRTEVIQPVLDFVPGAANELVLVRVCAIFDPFFPSTGLAAQIRLDATGAYALVATSAYVNEP